MNLAGVWSAKFVLKLFTIFFVIDNVHVATTRDLNSLLTKLIKSNKPVLLIFDDVPHDHHETHKYGSSSRESREQGVKYESVRYPDHVSYVTSQGDKKIQSPTYLQKLAKQLSHEYRLSINKLNKKQRSKDRSSQMVKTLMALRQGINCAQQDECKNDCDATEDSNECENECEDKYECNDNNDSNDQCGDGGNSCGDRETGSTRGYTEP